MEKNEYDSDKILYCFFNYLPIDYFNVKYFEFETIAKWGFCRQTSLILTAKLDFCIKILVLQHSPFVFVYEKTI